VDKKYLAIVDHYERCLERHGDSHLGVDWPKADDVETRYRVMLGVLKTPLATPTVLLDLGCGAAHLYEHLLRNPVPNLLYRGQDISPRFIELCRRKFPDVTFTCGDMLEPDQEVPACDYVVMNGVFTEKRELTHDEMSRYFQAVLTRVFHAASVGVAFNVMSKQVDWERPDLFHLPLDELAWFLTRHLSRNFIVRNDYGLYEYTTYLYK
jgi:SAM-dependent methyltransferase